MKDIGETIEETIKQALKDRGEVNILIAGKTGVGKSTLINAVFQGDFATTGSGMPVTLDTREYKKQGIPLKLYDTRGLELETYKKVLSDLDNFIKVRNNDSDAKNHIHIAWICIDESSRRIEEGEIELCEMLSKYMPVVGVITKASSDDGFRIIVQKFLNQAKNIVRVNSISRILDDGHIIMPSGLKELVEVSMEVVPEAQKNAFAAAQKVDKRQKKNRSLAIISTSAAAAATAAAVPIPFSDAFVLVPIQVGMLAGITAVFGFDLTKGFLSTLVSSTITMGGATMIGKTVVANLLKMFPGAGSVAGGAIAASTAMALTVAFGGAYISTLEYLLEEKDFTEISENDIIDTFKKRVSIGNS